MVNLSANEVAALTKLATRGAGYPWGLCEEAATAVRWLSTHQIPAAQWLALLCQYVDGKGVQQVSPVLQGSTWLSKELSLCPLMCGAALSDRADTLTGQWHLAIHDVYAPVLLIPFVYQLSVDEHLSLRLSWNSTVVECYDHIVNANMDCSATDLQVVNEDLSATVTIACMNVPGKTQVVWKPDPTARPDLSASCLQQLKGFAHRTYAPDTELSRQLGAGAGESDND